MEEKDPAWPKTWQLMVGNEKIQSYIKFQNVWFVIAIACDTHTYIYHSVYLYLYLYLYLELELEL